MSEALTFIHARKTVRMYSGEPVSPEVLETLMKAGMAAPSANNRKPWAFVAVTERDLLVRLSQGLQNGKMVQKAAAAIAVCGVMAKALSGGERDFWIQDCSAASENILLAAEAEGLGAAWTGVYPMADRVAMIQSILGLPPDVIPLNIIAVGHPSGGEKAKNKFDPACIHWEKW